MVAVVVGVADDVDVAVDAAAVVAAVGGAVAVDVAVVANGQVMDVCAHCLNDGPVAMVACAPVRVATTRTYFHQPYHPDGSGTDCTDCGERSRAIDVSLVASELLEVLVRSLFPVPYLHLDCYPRFRSNFVPDSPTQPTLWQVVQCANEPETQAEGLHQRQQPPVVV